MTRVKERNRKLQWKISKKTGIVLCARGEE